MRFLPWLSKYPSGVPSTVTLDGKKSLVGLLEDVFSQYKHLPMLENMGKTLTYGEVDRLSKNFAAYLQRHTPLKAGDHVALQLPNLLQYPIALFGVLRAGMVVVNVNPLYTPSEMAYQLKDAKAKAIVILENFAQKLEEVILETHIKAVCITSVGDALGSVKGRLVNFAVRYVKKLVPSYHLPQACSWRRAMGLGKKARFERVLPQAHQTAFLQYTGGTTGVSKAAMLTHANVLANTEQMLVCMHPMFQSCKEVVITPLPLYHVLSLICNLLTCMRLGAKNVLITNPRDLVALIKELRKQRFTLISGVNTLFRALMTHPAFSSIDFTHLKAALTGGMALQKQVAQQWQERTGRPLIEGYGLTEASPVVSFNMLDGTHRLGTIGIPLPSTLVRVVDEQGKDVPAGVPGHLMVQGPQVMAGYWNKPAETQLVLEGGWLRTGDVAFMDEEGFLTIVDRLKDMINVSGFNVYPSEIEYIIQAHPKVAEVGAVGAMNAQGQEMVKVYVVKQDPSLTEHELIAYCRTRMTGYKVPKWVEFRDCLPKSHLGKVVKRVLRAESTSSATV